ncbi:hypothetical protein ACFRJ9_00150 [Paenarthrobacter sp. NPDC056912]|uniref:hypothetical protein n=1 Tax=Paenarthrobacter sp. NPDC056912 TaxID=3345965 RepID=UPI00366B9D3E
MTAIDSSRRRDRSAPVAFLALGSLFLVVSATGLNVSGLLIDDHHVILHHGYLYPLWFGLAIGALLALGGIVWLNMARRGHQRALILGSGHLVPGPNTLIIVGGVLLALWVLAMQISGYIIDEQHLDPSGSLWQLMWFGGPPAFIVLVVGLIWRGLRRRAAARTASPNVPWPGS